MKCRSKNGDASYVIRDAYSCGAAQHSVRKTQRKAFSLIEAVTALAILSFVSLSVLAVIDRCIASAADSMLRMQAFSVARENMEALLSAESVKEMVEAGDSDRYPQIQWQTTVETFYEPITTRMWVQAVCSTEYMDTAGEVQTVELTHWLTNLTKQQLLEIIKDRFAKTLEESADYAGVDVETIEQWVENGMPTNKDGYYIKDQLDLYKQTQGSPTAEDIKLHEERDERSNREPGNKEQEPGAEEEPQESSEQKTGGMTIGGKFYTYEELEQMPFEQVWELLLEHNRR